ncbi:extensin-like domain-containing protein [Parerythrobacter jejuensis]|uniref:Extensin n=1 Tax=Parerythrobacter jejuensis TaxID=795812 RepID=A0A845APK2_9SPHN|nr:extensin family protein [Parerythrobacter jejuensis]MXP32230.1 extensin [Parerythrobacter jejuensis]
MNWSIRRSIGKLRWDRYALLALLCFAAAIGGWNWLQDNPGSNPWAPLDLRDPPGWATERKLVSLRENPAQCRAVLERSAVAFSTLPSAGEGPCRRADPTRLEQFPFTPSSPATSCAVAAGLEIWLEQGVQPAAREIYGQKVAGIEHLGAYNCRRIYGADEGPWSEHATANAIDIAAFVLEDGSRISLLNNWDDQDDDAKFLRRGRDTACDVFGTVLSPDYNAAHRDHFHFDQKGWGFGGACR